jgi:hypothetical protein
MFHGDNSLTLMVPQMFSYIQVCSPETLHATDICHISRQLINFELEKLIIFGKVYKSLTSNTDSRLHNNRVAWGYIILRLPVSTCAIYISHVCNFSKPVSFKTRKETKYSQIRILGQFLFNVYLVTVFCKA